MEQLPNIVLILNDDMGYSDIGCYGGEVDTPNLDQLAGNGLRFTQFYNTARCSPSRASLLTGLHPHQTGIGVLTNDDGPEGYSGDLNDQCVTIAEVLKQKNYKSYMSGKWHVSNQAAQPSASWPNQRGFDEFFGTIHGAGSYYHPKSLIKNNESVDHLPKGKEDFYYTDAISDDAVENIKNHTKDCGAQPFFHYVAYTAPHWPLHAPKEVVEKYKGRFNAGWDQLREERMEKMVKMGILDGEWALSERDPSQPQWEDAEHEEWLQRCMEVYAAQIDVMDQGIGRIIAALEECNQLDNTLIVFLADNGGCAEVIEPNWKGWLTKASAREKTRDDQQVLFGNRPDIMPGPENTYQSYGIAWANLSNTPFRLYKHWVHEGGIATPFIAHWPNQIKGNGELRHTPAQLPDVMATVLEIVDGEYPSTYEGREILPLEGHSLLPIFELDQREEYPLFWEHEGNGAIREGKWKLVKRYPGKWELYDMEEDRTELHDLAEQYPERVNSMAKKYDAWAERCQVKDWKVLQSLK